MATIQTCIVYKTDVIKNKDSHIYYGGSDGDLNLGTITTQINFTIDITNKTENFQNTSGNYKTKAATST